MEYLWKASAVLGICYFSYKLFLERDTFFSSIRIYLLTGILLSFVVPLIEITRYVKSEVVAIPYGQWVSNSVAVTETASWDLTKILIGAYTLGVILFLGRFLVQLTSLMWLLYRQPYRREGKYHILPTSKNLAPFSFFNHIVYPHNRFNEKELEQVIAHEKAHADGYHSVDILLVQLLCIVQWFNPVAWLYARDVRKNLEYIADEGLCQQEHQTKSYQYLLLKSISPVQNLALTNKFYNSLIKKRIKMIQKNRSSKLMHVKFGIVIPLLAAFVLLFNTKVVAQKEEDKVVHIEKNIEVVVIDKDMQESDFEALKAKLLKKGIELNVKKTKYNDKNELTGIYVEVSNKQGNKANLQQQGDKPIRPIKIQFDNEGQLGLSNAGFDSHFGGEHAYKTYKDKDGKRHIVITEGGKTIDIKKSGDNEMVFVSKDGDKKVVHKKIIVEKGDANDTHVWVSSDGDSTKVKNIQIIELDGEHDGEHNVFVKKIDGDEEDMVIEVKVDEESTGKSKKVMMFGNSDEKPLIVVDGKEMPNSSIEDIDSDRIETIEVLKGDSATKKYGDKAKNGVIEITTKKS